MLLTPPQRRRLSLTWTQLKSLGGSSRKGVSVWQCGMFKQTRDHLMVWQNRLDTCSMVNMAEGQEGESFITLDTFLRVPIWSLLSYFERCSHGHPWMSGPSSRPAGECSALSCCSPKSSASDSSPACRTWLPCLWPPSSYCRCRHRERGGGREGAGGDYRQKTAEKGQNKRKTGTEIRKRWGDEKSDWVGNIRATRLKLDKGKKRFGDSKRVVEVVGQ